MSFQQKLWIKLLAVLRALCPLLLYLCLPALVLAIGRSIRKTGMTTEEFAAASGNFYTALGIILVIWLFYLGSKRRKVNFFEDIILSFDIKDWKKILMMFAFGIGTAIGISAIITLLPLPEFLSTDYTAKSQMIYKGTDILLVIISQLILAPFVEEVVFRGYMLNRLLPALQERTSIIIVTVIFALCHLSGIWILYALTMGYLLTKVTIHEDNLIYAIAMHVGFNLPSVVNFLIMQSDDSRNFIYGSSLLIALYGMIGFAVAILLGRLYYQKENGI